MVNLIDEHIAVISLLKTQLSTISAITAMIIEAYKNENKVIVFGNGGSAVDAEHFVCELVSKFKINRKGLNAIALSSNPAILTAIGNDFSFDEVFSRQVVAYADKGDIVIGLSTSGTSTNVIQGLQIAESIGAKPILITGMISGNMKNEFERVLRIPSENTPRIQEAYLLVIHMICEQVEKILFDE